MIYAFVLAVGVVGVLVYLVFVLGEVPGMKAERLGELEALPPDLNQWQVDSESAEGRAASARGERREERLYLDEAHSGKLLRQVRYRDAEGAVLRAEPDVIVKRRRVRK